MWINVDKTSGELSTSTAKYLEKCEDYDMTGVALENLIDDISSGALQGVGYSAIKDRLQANELLYADGFRDLHTSLYSAQLIHQQELGSYLPEGGYIDSEKLAEQIRGLDDQVKSLYAFDAEHFSSLSSLGPSSNIVFLETLRDALVDKLQRLEAYAANTQWLYDDTNALSDALAEGAQYISGIYWDSGALAFIGSGDEGWRFQLADAQAAVLEDLLRLAR